MIVGGYSLHLYCDNLTAQCKGSRYGQAVFKEYDGHDERDCFKQARASGWKFNRAKTECYCPACGGRIRGDNRSDVQT